MLSMAIAFLVRKGPLGFPCRGFPCYLGVFSAYFTGMLRVRGSEKSLMFFEGFPWFFQKDQGKEGLALQVF